MFANDLVLYYFFSIHIFKSCDFHSQVNEYFCIIIKIMNANYNNGYQYQPLPNQLPYSAPQPVYYAPPQPQVVYVEDRHHHHVDKHYDHHHRHHSYDSHHGHHGGHRDDDCCLFALCAGLCCLCCCMNHD